VKEGDAKARLDFCKEVAAKPHGRIVFTDEKIANTNFHGLRRRWMPRGTHPAPGGNERYAASIHVWGAVGVGYRRLVFLPSGGITAEKYRRLCMIPAIKELEARAKPFIWQQDNARPHVAECNLRWLDNRGTQLLSWPARSPDLSPIETIWAIVQRRVDALTCSSREELQQAWAAEWKALDQDVIDRTVLSFARRLAACRVAKGGIFHLPAMSQAAKRVAAKKQAPKAVGKRAKGAKK
jgi:hypothetical protein